MSRIVPQQIIQAPTRPIRVAETPPTVEQLLCMYIIANWDPARPDRPYPLVKEIGEAMAPHQSGAINECYDVGWIDRAYSTKQIPTTCRCVTPVGHEAMKMTDYALEELDKRLVHEGGIKSQRNTPDEHTNLPKLRALREWLEDLRKQLGQDKPKTVAITPPKPRVGLRRPKDQDPPKP